MSVTTTTWLDVMPAIPLARGVPVIEVDHLDGHPPWHGIVLGRNSRGSWVVKAPELAPGSVRAPEYSEGEANELLRVDLDDPQGFGYALRRLGHDGADEWDDLLIQLMDRWGSDWGSITDADRLALAKAIAEVTK